MLETMFADTIRIFHTTFLNGDWVGLGIAFGSVLLAALFMQRGTQIGSMTLLALVLFVLGGFGRAMLARPADGVAPEVTGARAAAQVEASWAQFMNMQAGTLVAYFIAFMVLIIALFGLKAVVRR